MSKSAAQISEWNLLHDEWAAKETAHDAAWREYLSLADAVQAKQTAASRGHPDAVPGPDDLARMQEAKKRWEQIARELAALSERMTGRA
ncbi:MAG: hypothetical protein ACT4OG_05540 [Alphaproteobacteria bacterium]